MIHYDNCPFCRSGNINQVFPVKDHTVSGELFTICKCSDCGGMFTQDVPAQEAIGPYYASQNYVSHSNTQKGFINGLYHKVRIITLTAKRKMIVALTKVQKGNILDVGCGTGAFLNEMKRAGWQITGLEPDEVARRNAVELFGIYPMSSQELFALPARSFTAITMWHVLEHVHQLHEYLDQLRNLLADNGRLFIAVPNYTSYDAQHYQDHWAAYDTPRHLYHFSPASMRALLKQHSLEVIEAKPMWFDSFYVSMLSEQYKNGKGNIIAALLIGFVSNLKALFNSERCSSVIYVIKKES
jgi:2-polyprenyl-3-methyl-5-hydroxy-6-metoxy-1,4-benzoquinol methylase